MPDIFGRDPDALGRQVAKLAKLAHGIGQAAAKPADVRTALGRRDQVDIALAEYLVVLTKPGDDPIGLLVVALDVTRKRRIRDSLGMLESGDKIVAHTVLEAPGLVVVRFRLVTKRDRQPRAQHGLRTQQALQARDRELRRIEVLRIRPEANGGARVARAHAPDDTQVGLAASAGKAHRVFLAAATHVDLEPAGERVDDGDTDAVQTAGEGVVLVGEFSAGMKAREDDFHARHLFLLVTIHRHAAPVVAHGH